MAEPVLIIATTAEVAARRAAEELTRAAQHAVAEKGSASIALSGGSSVVPLLRFLASPPLVELVPWDKTDFFWSDERCVPASEATSNHGVAVRELFEHVPAPRERVHLPPVGAGSPSEIADLYEAEVVRAIGDGGVPSFDVILLGMGNDGHTASLFPGSDAVGNHQRLVLATKAPVAPFERISFGPLLLLNAKRIQVVATGEGKAGILREVLCGETDPNRYPTQLLADAKGHVLWYLDRASAKQLPLPPSSGGPPSW